MDAVSTNSLPEPEGNSSFLKQFGAEFLLPQFEGCKATPAPFNQSAVDSAVKDLKQGEVTAACQRIVRNSISTSFIALELITRLSILPLPPGSFYYSADDSEEVKAYRNERSDIARALSVCVLQDLQNQLPRVLNRISEGTPPTRFGSLITLREVVKSIPKDCFGDLLSNGLMPCVTNALWDPNEDIQLAAGACLCDLADFSEEVSSVAIPALLKRFMEYNSIDEAEQDGELTGMFDSALTDLSVAAPKVSIPLLNEALDSEHTVVRSYALHARSMTAAFNPETKSDLVPMRDKLERLLNDPCLKPGGLTSAASLLGCLTIGQYAPQFLENHPELDSKSIVLNQPIKKLCPMAFSYLSEEKQMVRSIGKTWLSYFQGDPDSAVDDFIKQLGLFEYVPLHDDSEALPLLLDLTQVEAAWAPEAQLDNKHKLFFQRRGITELLSVFVAADPKRHIEKIKSMIASEHPSIQIAGVHLLKETGSQAADCLNSLTGFLDSNIGELRRSAFKTLRGLGDAAYPAMSRLINFAIKGAPETPNIIDDPDGFPKINWTDNTWSPVTSVIYAIGKERPHESLIMLAAGLGSPDPKRRYFSIAAISHFINRINHFRSEKILLGSRETNYLRRVLSEEAQSIELRIEAAKALGYAGHNRRAVSASLLVARENKNKMLSSAATESLGKLGSVSNAALSFIISDFSRYPYHSEYPNFHVNDDIEQSPSDNLIDSVVGICRSDPKKYLAIMKRHFSLKEDPKNTAGILNVAYQLADYLADSKQLPDTLIGPLARLLESHHKDVRAGTALLLGEYGERALATVPQLLKLAKWDPEDCVREYSHAALGRIGEPRDEILELLFFSLERCHHYLSAIDPNSQTDMRATDGVFSGFCALIGRDWRADRTVAALQNHRNSNFREGIATGLGYCKSFEAAEPYLLQALNDSEPMVRQLATGACRYLGPKAVDLLIAQTRSTVDTTVEHIALQSLDHIGKSHPDLVRQKLIEAKEAGNPAILL